MTTRTLYTFKHNLTDIGQFFTSVRGEKEKVNVEYLSKKFLRGEIESLFFKLADHICPDEVEYKSYKEWEPQGNLFVAKMRIGKCTLEVVPCGKENY